MNRTKHSVIIIPGLGDNRIFGKKMLELATGNWQNYGLTPVVCAVDWHNSEDLFQSKLDRLVKLVDQLVQKGDTVSLVGISAGGSAALNVFVRRSDIVYRAINVCGRLRTGSRSGFRSFYSKTASSPSFAESVRLFESCENKMSESDRLKVMTICSMLGDELVPPETTKLPGAFNTMVPAPEHLFSILIALTLFSKPLIRFLNGQIN